MLAARLAFQAQRLAFREVGHLTIKAKNVKPIEKPLTKASRAFVICVFIQYITAFCVCILMYVCGVIVVVVNSTKKEKVNKLLYIFCFTEVASIETLANVLAAVAT